MANKVVLFARRTGDGCSNAQMGAEEPSKAEIAAEVRFIAAFPGTDGKYKLIAAISRI